MALPINNRNRGVILTYEGLKKLEDAKQALQEAQNQGKRYTLEQLNQLTGLALGTISKIFNQKAAVDKRTLIVLFHAFNLELTSSDYSAVPTNLSTPSAKLTTKYQDWGEAIDVSEFHCCQCPFNKLKQWIIEENCRIVMLLGMVGIGKTTLSIQVSQQLIEEFDYIIFRSLNHAPFVENIVSELVKFFSQGQENKANFRKLLHYLRLSRCLIIFDNLDSILAQQEYAGKYRENYEQYGQLLQMIGETNHQSCLIITSRENIREIAMLEGLKSKVRSLNLSGCPDVSMTFFKDQNLLPSQKQRQELAIRYNHNPLILKIISISIKDLFDGKIQVFLDRKIIFWGVIRQLFDQQFNRLTSLEQTIIYYLAIHPTGTTITDLQRDIVPSVSTADLLEAMESLTWRSLINSNNNTNFTLLSLFQDYIAFSFER